MKKFTDKIFHHHQSQANEQGEITEEKLAHKEDTYTSFDDKSTTKQHSFGTGITEKIHNVTHPSHHTQVSSDTHVHEHIHEHINPPIVDTIIRPTIVEETIRREKVVEVQPIVHRRVEAPEVHHIERHVYEKLPPAGPSLITKQPVVEETIQPHITEELTTVVHREVPAPFIVHEEKHTTQHIVNPVIHTSEVIEEKLPVVATKEVLVEERRTAEWEDQKDDRCPLALREKGYGNVMSSATTTTTTSLPTTTTTQQVEPDLRALEEKHLGRVTFQEEKRHVAAGGLPTPLPLPNESLQKYI